MRLPVDENLGHLLLKAARLYDAEAIRRVQRHYPTVRSAHTSLMPYLDAEGTRPTVLARRAGVTKQAIGQLVRDMEALGFVDRVPDPADGRARLVRLTDRGRDAVLQGLGVLKGLQEELAETLGEEAMQALVAQLTGVVTQLEALDEPA